MGEMEKEPGDIGARGFVVIESLLTQDLLGEIRRTLQPHLRVELLGRNDFEGYRTERVYSLVGHGTIFEDLVEHPRILGICEAFLEQNYLLTASQAINIHP